MFEKIGRLAKIPLRNEVFFLNKIFHRIIISKKTKMFIYKRSPGKVTDIKHNV